MKKYMPLEGLRWSRDSGSALCDTSQNSRSRTGWGGMDSAEYSTYKCNIDLRTSGINAGLAVDLEWKSGITFDVDL